MFEGNPILEASESTESAANLIGVQINVSNMFLHYSFNMEPS